LNKYAYNGTAGEYSGGPGFEVDPKAARRGLTPPRDASHTMRALALNGTPWVEDPPDPLIWEGHTQDEADILQQKIDDSYNK
jgi:hypothetical protein